MGYRCHRLRAFMRDAPMNMTRVCISPDPDCPAAKV
jgi:hypothetical protein